MTVSDRTIPVPPSLSMEYMDEAGREMVSQPAAGPLPPSALSVKRLSLDGVTLHSVEFPADRRAQPGSMAASFSEHAVSHPPTSLRIRLHTY